MSIPRYVDAIEADDQETIVREIGGIVFDALSEESSLDEMKARVRRVLGFRINADPSEADVPARWAEQAWLVRAFLNGFNGYAE